MSKILYRLTYEGKNYGVFQCKEESDNVRDIAKAYYKNEFDKSNLGKSTKELLISTIIGICNNCYLTKVTQEQLDEEYNNAKKRLADFFEESIIIKNI